MLTDNEGNQLYTRDISNSRSTQTNYRKATKEEVANTKNTLYTKTVVTIQKQGGTESYVEYDGKTPDGYEGVQLYKLEGYVTYDEVTGTRNDTTTYYIADENDTNTYSYKEAEEYEVTHVNDASEYVYAERSYLQDEVRDQNKTSKDVTYIIGAPVTFQVSLKDYYDILTGEFINWSRRPYSFTGSETTTYENSLDGDGSESKFELIEALGHSAFIMINTSRTCINENFEGYYIGITDNMFTTPSDDYVFNAISGVKITTETFNTKNTGIGDNDDRSGIIDHIDPSKSDYSVFGPQRLTFKLDSNNQGSLSRVMSRNITMKDISSTEFDDSISLGLFKLSKTTDSNDVLKLNYTLREKYNWSFAKSRMKSDSHTTKPVSYFASSVMENSNNITILVNPFIAEKDFITYDGLFHGKIRVLGDKLLQNLNMYESKYLSRSYTLATMNDNNKSLILPHKLANNNIQSYKNMIKQAGISPYLLRTTFRSNIT